MTTLAGTDAFAALVAELVAEALRPDVARLLVPADDDVLEGTEAIASYLHLSVNHVSRHLGTTIPARQVGRSWVASKVALTAWLACREGDGG